MRPGFAVGSQWLNKCNWQRKQNFYDDIDIQRSALLPIPIRRINFVRPQCLDWPLRAAWIRYWSGASLMSGLTLETERGARTSWVYKRCSFALKEVVLDFISMLSSCCLVELFWTRPTGKRPGEDSEHTAGIIHPIRPRDTLGSPGIGARGSS